MAAMLNDSQLGFFARNGFLQVGGLIDPDICAKLVDHTWSRLPAHWNRDEPASWRGAVTDSCHVADLTARRGHLKFQKGDLIGHPVIEQAFSREAAGGALARSLLGAPLSPMRPRGLYCITPLPSGSCSPYFAPHIESHAVQLIAMCYLDDVAPGGGGLHVWPGSHRAVYPVMGSRLEHIATPEYEAVFARYAGLAPVELPGRRGDIVIIHHRLLHAPSVNRSGRIRFAFLCDYQRHDFKSLAALRPSADIWEDWAAIAALPAVSRDAPCDFDLQPLSSAAEMAGLPQAAVPAASTKADPSSIRKADASALVRARRAGDKWLLISDDPFSAAERTLLPRGSDLSTTGLRVTLNGTPVTSASRHDLISRLDAAPGQNRITIEGLDRKAWLRVLDIRLPFDDSALLLREALGPGTSEFNFTIA